MAYLSVANLLPWVLAFPLCVWEFRNVARKNHFLLAMLAAIVVFSATFGWGKLVVSSFDFMPLGIFSAVEAISLLVFPPFIAALVARKTILAIGVLAGLVVIFCIIWLSFVIGAAFYGGE